MLPHGRSGCCQSGECRGGFYECKVHCLFNKRGIRNTGGTGDYWKAEGWTGLCRYELGGAYFYDADRQNAERRGGVIL